MTSPLTGETTNLLHRLRAGDERARGALIEHASAQLRRLASRMLQGFPGVGRWEQTDDVLQNALIRLHRALAGAAPESSRHFYNLAALQIRRELLDLADHHLGPHGHAPRHHSDGAGRALDAQPDAAAGPSSLEEWRLFHERIEALPEQERELFGLLWYEGLTQESAAEVLDVSLRTVKRRWQSARLHLTRALSGGHPL